MTEREFLCAIEGADNTGHAKATCVASIIQPSENDEPELIAQIVIHSGTVYTAIVPGGLSMIDILFDSNINYELLQLGGLCESFFDFVADSNKSGTPFPTLSLSIMENNTLTTSMTAVDCVWTYIPVTVEKVCVGVRFICKSNNILFTELSDEQADVLLNSVLVDNVLREMQEDIENGQTT